jgi:hypothetical protein
MNNTMSPDTKYNKVEDLIVAHQPPLPRRKHSDSNKLTEKNIHLHKLKNASPCSMNSKVSLGKRRKETNITNTNNNKITIDDDDNDVFIEATDSDISFYVIISHYFRSIHTKKNVLSLIEFNC